jgi:hypothetical protein
MFRADVCCDTAPRSREHGLALITGVITTKTAPGPNEGLARWSNGFGQTSFLRGVGKNWNLGPWDSF